MFFTTQKTVNKVRCTKTGVILLEVTGKDEATRLSDNLQSAVGEIARVSRPSRSTPMLILDIPDWLEEGDHRSRTRSGGGRNRDTTERRWRKDCKLYDYHGDSGQTRRSSDNLHWMGSLPGETTREEISSLLQMPGARPSSGEMQCTRVGQEMLPLSRNWTAGWQARRACGASPPQ